MLNEEKIDNSINFGGDYKGSGDIISGTGAAKNVGEINTDKITKTTIDNSVLTPEDWTALEKYFIMYQKEFTMNDKNYKICSNLITYSRQREIGKFRRYLGLEISAGKVE